MKQTQFFTLVLSVFLICFFTVSIESGNLNKESKIIKQKMGEMGFAVGKISKLKNGNFNIFLSSFNQKTKGIILKRTLFKPFYIKARLLKGNLYLLKGDFINFSINTKLLLPAVKIVKLFPGYQLKPVKNVLLKPVRPILFTQVDWGDVEMAPPVLTIKYGNNVLNLNNASRGDIQIPENSDLIVEAGKVEVTVELTLKNKTTKNFRFNINLNYGGTFHFIKNITLLNGDTRTVSKVLKLSPTNSQYKNISILGPVGISDDTHISFFLAILMLRVYAL